jgi:multidrug resistance protein
MSQAQRPSSPDPTAAPPPRASRATLAIVFATVFIDLLGFGIVIPLLPVYSQAFGASELELGLLFSSFSAMQFLFAPLWGRLSDRIGRRPVLIGGLLGTAGSYLLFAQAESMRLLFLSRAMAGFFGANISTAQAVIADVTPPEHRAKGMGLIGAAFGLGFTLGPLFGGELTRVSSSAPGWAAAGLSLLAALVGFWRLPETRRAGGARARLFGFEQLRRALREPRLGTPYLLYFLAVFAFSCFEAMFTRFGLARFPAQFNVPRAIEQASAAEVMAAAPIAGRYLAAIGILSALIQGGLIRRLVPRFGETALAWVGPLLLGLALASIGASGRAGIWSGVLIGCALMPLGFGLNNPALNGLISRAAPDSEQGAYLGLSQSLASLARVTGPPVAGLAYAAGGPSSPFFLAALVLALATLVAGRYHLRYAGTFPRHGAQRA